ncbi:MAG: DsrE family protein [Sphingomonas sp.]
MRGLTILVTTGDPARFRAALTLASAHAALDGGVRVFCHEHAVALLAAGEDPEAAVLAAHGLPDRAALIEIALASGATIVACQTGLALAGLAETNLPVGVETGGMVGLLAALGDDRLVAV